MKQYKKDIFGNVYTVNEPNAKSFEQKLREAKARQKYKKFQQEQRAAQIQKAKMAAQRSKEGLAKISGKIKAGYKRATDKRLPSFRDKLCGSIYKKE
jgi:acyl-CoA reductase-like NAD-dependent aldehyde dehydrogenase